MNRDEARKILGESATEEQITNLLNNYHVQESNKVKELERQLNEQKEVNNKYSDYDAIKKQLDDINKANMTREEQIALMEKTAKENLSKSNIILNTTKAKEILVGLELDDETISMLVSDDAEKTINNATKLKASIDAMKENVAKQTKESLANADLKPTISNVNQGEEGMTFDKFRTLSVDEQNKFAEEHPEEFENL